MKLSLSTKMITAGEMANREISTSETDPFIIQRVVSELQCASYSLVLRVQR